MTTLAVLQPGYLPWLGFFDQMNRADVFVYYDDVQYDKHGWRNRNRVKSMTGPVWLTVPVRHSGLGMPPVNQVEIDNRLPWARKHIQTLSQFYARAPYKDDYLPTLQEILERPWTRLIDLNLQLSETMRDWLSIDCEIHMASDLEIHGEQSGRLLALCRHFGANVYLTGDSARDYLDIDLFTGHGVHVEWQNYRHPEYPQLHGEFVSHLSAVDLLFNAGPRSRRIIEAGAVR